MCGLWMHVLEVPVVVVCSLRLRDLTIGLGLASVNHIRELHSVLNEEDRNVVANHIPVAFFCVMLDGESTDIADGIC
jgi:hypothetical protein